MTFCHNINGNLPQSIAIKGVVPFFNSLVIIMLKIFVGTHFYTLLLLNWMM